MKLSELVPIKKEAEIQFLKSDVYVTLVHTDEVLLRTIREESRDTGYSRRRGRRSSLEDLDDTLMVDKYCELVIKGWRGIDDDDGNPLPCTLETKKQLMHSNIDFRKWVIDESGHVPNFTVGTSEQQEDDEKKLNSFSTN